MFFPQELGASVNSKTPSQHVASLLNGIELAPIYQYRGSGVVFLSRKRAASDFPWSKAIPLLAAQS